MGEFPSRYEIERAPIESFSIALEAKFNQAVMNGLVVSPEDPLLPVVFEIFPTEANMKTPIIKGQRLFIRAKVVEDFTNNFLLHTEYELLMIKPDRNGEDMFELGSVFSSQEGEIDLTYTSETGLITTRKLENKAIIRIINYLDGAELI
jgi:hypothetical protein